jgi:hypothetical protein
MLLLEPSTSHPVILSKHERRRSEGAVEGSRDAGRFHGLSGYSHENNFARPRLSGKTIILDRSATAQGINNAAINKG